MVINGVGIYNCDFATVNDTCRQLDQLDLPELRFPPNKRVRLRFVHEGAHRESGQVERSSPSSS